MRIRLAAGRRKICQQATDGDQDRDQPGEYRAIDEELRHRRVLLISAAPGDGAAAGSWPGAFGCGACAATAFAGAPGCTFCRPETMTWSPSAMPPVITQRFSRALRDLHALLRDVARRIRGTITYGPTPSRSTASCGTRMPLVELTDGETQVDEQTRQQAPVRVRNEAAKRDGARGRIHTHVGKIERTDLSVAGCRP